MSSYSHMPLAIWALWTVPLRTLEISTATTWSPAALASSKTRRNSAGVGWDVVGFSLPSLRRV